MIFPMSGNTVLANTKPFPQVLLRRAARQQMFYSGALRVLTDFTFPKLWTRTPPASFSSSHALLLRLPGQRSNNFVFCQLVHARDRRHASDLTPKRATHNINRAAPAATQDLDQALNESTRSGLCGAVTRTVIQDRPPALDTGWRRLQLNHKGHISI